MKVPAFISRILLGVIFIVYGANGFFRFGHTDPFATPIAREYMTVMLATPYGHILFGLQIACGLLLIAGRLRSCKPDNPRGLHIQHLYVPHFS
jgi:uncharacterized membrane protein YphA (DoxX/SURF4 family)